MIAPNESMHESNKKACYIISVNSNTYAIKGKHWNGDGGRNIETTPSTDIMSEHTVTVGKLKQK